MLVHQCSSCKAIGNAISYAITDARPSLPKGWAKITLQLPGEHVQREYDLCVECLAMPITFGTIEFTKQS